MHKYLHGTRHWAPPADLATHTRRREERPSLRLPSSVISSLLPDTRALTSPSMTAEGALIVSMPQTVLAHVKHSTQHVEDEAAPTSRGASQEKVAHLEPTEFTRHRYTRIVANMPPRNFSSDFAASKQGLP
jgi:hypothetical protein